MTLWVIIIVAVAVAICAIVVFNRLVRTRQMANEAWSGIDVQLKRRSDLVPNLVEAAARAAVAAAPAGRLVGADGKVTSVSRLARQAPRR